VALALAPCASDRGGCDAGPGGQPECRVTRWPRHAWPARPGRRARMRPVPPLPRPPRPFNLKFSVRLTSFKLSSLGHGPSPVGVGCQGPAGGPGHLVSHGFRVDTLAATRRTKAGPAGPGSPDSDAAAAGFEPRARAAGELRLDGVSPGLFTGGPQAGPGTSGRAPGPAIILVT
jgi:hypothetical protein